MDFEDTVFKIILPVLVAILVIICAAMVYIFVDNCMTDIPNDAVVIKKAFTPAHHSIVLISTGKTIVPVNTFYPDEYNIVFGWDNEKAWRITSKRNFDMISTGMNYSYVQTLCGGL